MLFRSVGQERVLDLVVLSPGQRDLRLGGHGDGPGGEGPHIVQIDEIGAVGPQEAPKGHELAVQLVQAPGALQHRPIGQVQQR